MHHYSDQESCYTRVRFESSVNTHDNKLVMHVFHIWCMFFFFVCYNVVCSYVCLSVCLLFIFTVSLLVFMGHVAWNKPDLIWFVDGAYVANVHIIGTPLLSCVILVLSMFYCRLRRANSCNKCRTDQCSSFIAVLLEQNCTPCANIPDRQSNNANGNSIFSAAKEFWKSTKFDGVTAISCVVAYGFGTRCKLSLSFIEHALN